MSRKIKQTEKFKEAALLLEQDENLTVVDVAKEVGVDDSALSKFIRGFDFGKDFAASTDDEVAERMGKREVNLYKRQHLNNQKSLEANKLIRQEAFYERFVNEYIIPEIEPIKIKKYASVKSVTKDGIQRFLLGDIHYIDRDRSEEDVLAITEMVLKTYDGSKIISLELMGDFIENTHHRQQQIGKTTTVMNQIIEVSDLLAKVIAEISSNLSNVYINIEFYKGNHDEIRQLGVKAREDNESASSLILNLVKAKLTKYDKVNFLNEEAQSEIILEQEKAFVFHGDVVKGDLQSWFLKKRLQEDRLKDINYVFVAHSHKFKHEIVKGSSINFVNVPCLKSWTSEWERETNNIGTVGIVSMDNEGTIMFVGREE